VCVCVQKRESVCVYVRRLTYPAILASGCAGVCVCVCVWVKKTECVCVSKEIEIPRLFREGLSWFKCVCMKERECVCE